LQKTHAVGKNEAKQEGSSKAVHSDGKPEEQEAVKRDYLKSLLI
jgi:hypothetical protein